MYILSSLIINTVTNFWLRVYAQFSRSQPTIFEGVIVSWTVEEKAWSLKFQLWCGVILKTMQMDKLISKIFTTPKKLKISKIFVYQTFKRLMETGTVVDHPQQGRPCIIRTRRLTQTVAASIQWNSMEKQSVVAWELNVSKMSMSDVLRSDIGLKAYQQSTSHFLTLCLKEQGAIKAKCLFQH